MIFVNYVSAWTLQREGGNQHNWRVVSQHLHVTLEAGQMSLIFVFYHNLIFTSGSRDLATLFDSQAAELRAYLKSKGAELSQENSEGGLHVDLAQIIEACDVCLKEDDKGLF